MLDTILVVLDVVRNLITVFSQNQNQASS